MSEAEAHQDLPERWSSGRKTEIVLRLLRGEDLGSVSRETQVPPQPTWPGAPRRARVQRRSNAASGAWRHGAYSDFSRRRRWLLDRHRSILAAALGVKAVKNGFSVTHFLLDDLMHALKQDAAVPPARLRAKRYLNNALLIVDEVGFRPLDRHEANLLFRLVSARYEKGSIILTTNKHVQD